MFGLGYADEEDAVGVEVAPLCTRVAVSAGALKGSVRRRFAGLLQSRQDALDGLGDKVEQKPFDLDERPFVYQQPVKVPLEPYLLHRSQGRKGIAFGVLGKERHGGSVSLSNELEAFLRKEYLK